MDLNTYDLTQGSILKKLLKLAVPIMGTQLMQMTYNLTDMFWLGRTEQSVVAVASSGLAGMYLWLSMALMMIGRMGSEIGTSQSVGRGDAASSKGYAQDSTRIALILGMFYGLVLIVLAEPLVALLRVNEQNVFDSTCTYLRVVGAGIPLTYVSAAITGVFNGAGNSRLSFWANAVGLLVNMVLDPLMILILGWGVKGAAIATVIAQATVCILFLCFIKRHPQRPFDKFEILGWPDYARVRKIIKWSLPIALESGIFTALAMVVTAMVSAWYGETAVAIQRVGSQIESLSWLVGGGFMAGEKRLDQFGGNAAYGCAGVRLWANGQVGMVARIGNNFPRQWIQQASDSGIDIQGVTKLREPHTLLGGMIYDKSGERDNYVPKSALLQAEGRGAADASPLTLHQAQVVFGADASDIPPAYDNVKGVMLAPRYLNKQLSCIEHYTKKKERPYIIADPMRFYMYLERSEELRRLLEQVDAFLPSESEVTHMFGDIDPVEGAKYLGEMGAKVVVVKLGKQGCVVYERETGTVTPIPIYPLEGRDPTGAGDSFCGGFLVGLTETKDPVLAAMYGTVSSSFIVEGFGADYTYSVTREMAEERLEFLKNDCAKKNDIIAHRLKTLGAL